MDEEVYDHLAKWRKVIRDLAKEAGIKKFADPSSDQNKESHAAPDSSNRNQVEKER
jgi:hypothetical protein